MLFIQLPLIIPPSFLLHTHKVGLFSSISNRTRMKVNLAQNRLLPLYFIYNNWMRSSRTRTTKQAFDFKSISNWEGDKYVYILDAKVVLEWLILLIFLPFTFHGSICFSFSLSLHYRKINEITKTKKYGLVPTGVELYICKRARPYWAYQDNAISSLRPPARPIWPFCAVSASLTYSFWFVFIYPRRSLLTPMNGD